MELGSIVSPMPLKRIMEDVIQFNRFLGLELIHADPTAYTIVRIPFRPQYIGDPVKRIVHGGILSTLVDVTGGATAFASFLPDLSGLAGINTVDMRVDYLRPGSGEWFEGRGRIVKKGSRIIFTHIEVFNDTGVQVAMGSAAYSVQQVD